MKKLIAWLGVIATLLPPGGLIIAGAVFIIRKLSGGKKQNTP